MSKIYVLYKRQPRAETTDTLFYYASFNRGDLEEIILSLWHEAAYLICMGPDNPTDAKWRRTTLDNYINQFDIVELPLI